MTDARETPLDQLELTMRTWNVMRTNNLKTIGDVLALDERELLRLPNFGRKSLNEIAEIFATFGLRIAGRSKRYIAYSISGEMFEKLKARALIENRSAEAEALAILQEVLGEDSPPTSIADRIARLEREVFKEENKP